MYEFETRIRYSETDADGRLTLLSLLDYFQDCSVFHSESVRDGIADLEEQHRAWILSAWHVVITELPGLGEPVMVRTWPYEMRGFFGLRNFAMDDKDGKRLAVAHTTWVYMDTETGRPARIPEHVTAAYGMDAPVFVSDKGRKLAAPKEYRTAGSLIVPTYFIDTNHHMNNSRYVMVAAGYLPEHYRIAELMVQYKKEAVLGDYMEARVTEEQSAVTVNLVNAEGKSYAIVRFISASVDLNEEA